jgi:hypothetical protein
MPMSTSSNISLDENDSFFEFKYPQDSRFRLRTTHWKISDKDLTDAGPSNVNINLDEKFGNVKKCQNTIYEDKLVFQCEECNRNFKNEKGLKIHRTRIHGLMGQSFLCDFPQKLIKQEGKMKQSINLYLLPWTMRNNPDHKIVNLMDLNDYVVLYVLENHLRITTD